MGYIDAHVHVWTDDTDTYPFAAGHDGDKVPRTFFPEDILGHAQPCGVDRVVLVQMSYYGADNRYMLQVMRDHPGVFGGIGIVDWAADSPEVEMKRLADAGVYGFRVYPRDVPVESWCDGAGFTKMFAAAADKRISVTPPPKAFLEEKMLFALFHNRNLAETWRQQLGDSFQRTLEALLPQTWVIDPAPLPPHAAFPGLGLTDWQQLKNLSQKERNLILKISGYSEQAWGARGVWLGSDLPRDEWAAVVDQAIEGFDESPRILQRYHRPARVDAEWFDFELGQAQAMQGRVRLCPYYFVHGEFDTAKATLGGVLATICPADKKIIHGMSDAILAPCALGHA